MRVVVTGATGNIGTSLLETLADDSHVDHVRGVARRRPRWAPARTSFAPADVRTDDLAALFTGFDAVIHLAWAFQPTRQPLETWDVNVLGSIRVFDAVAEAGVPVLIYCSSVGAYSPGPGRHVDESWPTHGRPTSAYGREKAYVERCLDRFVQEHPDVRVVRMRPCFVFKRESASEQRRIFAGRLFPRVLARPGRLPVLPVPPEIRMQAVHSADVAEAFRLALFSEATGAFNLAAPPVIDSGVLGEIAEARPVPVPARLAKVALGAAWRLRLVPSDDALFALLLQLPTLDAGRAERELGWQPRWTGDLAMREMLVGLADGAGMATPPLKPDGRGIS
jgi:UDP-glucose 4-epimerase